MPLKFNPIYKITNSIFTKLFEIEKIKEDVKKFPLSPKVLAGLRKTSKINTIHYSTKIEGNSLTVNEVKQVLDGKKIPKRERDEKEIKGYFRALDKVKELAKKSNITEQDIKILHGLVVGSKTPTAYREGQNSIVDSSTGYIVYMPPEAKDVSSLMTALVNWINENRNLIPAPVLAAIAHYQFVTIHPYYDGNGRTARVLTTLLLHQCGYGLNGIYNLEEYYAENLQDYYDRLTVGNSHNYYEGRAEADITAWVDFFVSGMLNSFESIKKHFVKQKNETDKSEFIKNLDSRQKQILPLFEESNFITTKDLEKIFHFSSRTSRQLAQKWVKTGFLVVFDNSKKNRKYKLNLKK